MIGLKRNTVQLHAHYQEWQQAFRKAYIEIAPLLKPWVLDIQHIGSTSIKGTIAKPIIDIGVLIPNMEVFQACHDQLIQLGYRYRGDAGQQGGHVFVKDSQPDIRTHNLHLIEVSDPQWNNYIQFRDYLNAHPEVAQAYADLKKQLADQFPNDRGAYTAGKTAFVRQVLSLV